MMVLRSFHIAAVLVFYSGEASLFVSHRQESLRNPGRYLIASGANGTVYYTKIPEQGLTGVATMTPLITDLGSPQGIAVDLLHRRLVVADTLKKTLVSYHLHSDRTRLFASDPIAVANDTDAHWVAVDGRGTIYYSEETTRKIMKAEKQGPRHYNDVTILYDGSKDAVIGTPLSIAADSFSVYWVSKAEGGSGSVMKGPSTTNYSSDDGLSQPAETPEVLAQTEAYGICIALQHVFYTQSEASIYGTAQRAGVNSTLISDRLANPRGCAFDGDGTVYVADHGADGVYAFAGSMQTLTTANLQKVADVKDVVGVAVFISSACTRALLFALLIPIVARQVAA